MATQVEDNFRTQCYQAYQDYQQPEYLNHDVMQNPMAIFALFTMSPQNQVAMYTTLSGMPFDQVFDIFSSEPGPARSQAMDQVMDRIKETLIQKQKEKEQFELDYRQSCVTALEGELSPEERETYEMRIRMFDLCHSKSGTPK